MLIKFFDEYTLDPTKTSEESGVVLLPRSDSEAIESPFLDGKNTRNGDSVILEQDGDIYMGQKMRQIHAKILSEFEPKDSIDT